MSSCPGLQVLDSERKSSYGHSGPEDRVLSKWRGEENLRERRQPLVLFMPPASPLAYPRSYSHLKLLLRRPQIEFVRPYCDSNITRQLLVSYSADLAISTYQSAPAAPATDTSSRPLRPPCVFLFAFLRCRRRRCGRWRWCAGEERQRAGARGKEKERARRVEERRCGRRGRGRGEGQEGRDIRQHESP